MNISSDVILKGRDTKTVKALQNSFDSICIKHACFVKLIQQNQKSTRCNLYELAHSRTILHNMYIQCSNVQNIRIVQIVFLPF